MQMLSTRVIELRYRCEDIVSVLLARPAGYVFSAGQWFRMSIETAEGNDVRTFSHAAAPIDDWIEATTRLSGSAFKQALTRLSVDDPVSISPAGGRLRLAEGAQRLAVLVGGTGITPVRSLLRDAAQCGRRFSEAVVFYGNRDLSCEPYLEELEAMRDSGVRLVRVLEHPGPEWEGESGFISAELVKRHADILDGRPVLVAGPPMMVVAMERVLDELGVASESRLVESFGSAPGTPG